MQCCQWIRRSLLLSKDRSLTNSYWFLNGTLYLLAKSTTFGGAQTVLSELKELLKYRELLYMITYRDIKVRYKQSVMGFLWAILMPILIVMSGVVVRYAYSLASHVTLQASDVASVAVKSLPWAFLVSSIRFSCNS